MIHWNRNPLRSRGTAMARLLSVTLTLALVLAGTPGPTIPAAGTAPGAAEAHHYFRSGDELFRLDADDLADCHRLLSGHEGTHTVTLARARFEDAAVLAATGGAVEQAIEWEPVLSWTVTATLDSVASRFRRGTDQLSLSIPWELLEKGDQANQDDPAAWLEINGMVTRLDPSDLARFRSFTANGEAPPVVDLDGEYDAAAVGFADLSGFVTATQEFLIVDGTILRNDLQTHLDATTAGESCVPGCLACAGSLLTSTAAYIALVGTCGGALVTGGATALACIATFIGVQATHIAMLSACGKCYKCLEKPTCPCAGEPTCDCS